VIGLAESHLTQRLFGQILCGRRPRWEPQLCREINAVVEKLSDDEWGKVLKGGC
jgi:hypothetical protein